MSISHALELKAREVIGRNVNMAVPWFLSTSYAYYKEAETLISDEYFDRICKLIDEHWDNITHPHKYLINRDSLSAGTGFDIEFGLFPIQLQSSTQLLILMCQGKMPLHQLYKSKE